MEIINYNYMFGTLEKIEHFNTLSQNILLGSLAFESPSPFWGYYSDDPHDYKGPLYVYIAILPIYEVLDVSRAFKKVRLEIDFDFDAAYAEIKFNDRHFTVIRIRHLNDYSLISKIQSSFVKNGVSMLMASGHWQNLTVHVKLKKIFGIEKISEHVYIDALEKNHAYITIKDKLSFEDFVFVTQKVRNNWLSFKFDAALGAFMKEKGIEEVVRIYTEHLDIETLNEIHSLYLQQIERI